MLQTSNRLANMPGPFEVGRREFRRGFNGNGDVRRGDSPNYPPLSVHDDGRQIVLEWDIPGAPREDLDLALANGQLQICGRRARPQRDAACRYDDWRYGEFQRTVRSPPIRSMRLLRAECCPCGCSEGPGRNRSALT